MKRTILILLDSLVIGGVVPGCGTAIMGLVGIAEPEAKGRILDALDVDFVQVVPGIAERDLDEHPVALEGAGDEARDPPPGGAIAQAVEAGKAPPPPAEPGPAEEPEPIAEPLPVPAAPAPGPAEPEWEIPLMPAVEPSSGPVERSVASPGSDLDSAVKGLVAKLGQVAILKTTILSESGDPKRLVAFYAMSHHEVLVVDPIDAEGRVSPEALALFEDLMRSSRTGSTHAVDPGLVRLLYAAALAHDGVLEISSGYREPGHGTKPSSMHTKGMAADVRHPYLPAKSIADFARAWGAGGVGYYPRSRFVHLDVRETPFYWVDESGAGEKGAVAADMDGTLSDIAAAKWEGIGSPLFEETLVTIPEDAEESEPASPSLEEDLP